VLYFLVIISASGYLYLQPTTQSGSSHATINHRAPRVVRRALLLQMQAWCCAKAGGQTLFTCRFYMNEPLFLHETSNADFITFLGVSQQGDKKTPRTQIENVGPLAHRPTTECLIGTGYLSVAGSS
jgi:hypothetical protein